MKTWKRIGSVESSDVLRAHSTFGAQGWQLRGDLPSDAPPRAIGRYERAGREAVLVQEYRTFTMYLGA